MSEWHSKGWMITEIPSDNAAPGGTDPDFLPIDNFAVTADNIPVANFWAIRYRMITLANLAIEQVAGMDLSDDRKAPLLAEARFLRALAYFDLVRIYGGVPLITQPPVFGDDLLPSRALVSEVYDQMIADFSNAAEHLPLSWSGSNIGRATQGAAFAYLSKVYLTNRQYVDARDAAKRVMDLNVYQLMPDFADNFELATSDNNCRSHLSDPVYRLWPLRDRQRAPGLLLALGRRYYQRPRRLGVPDPDRPDPPQSQHDHHGRF